MVPSKLIPIVTPDKFVDNFSAPICACLCVCVSVLCVLCQLQVCANTLYIPPVPAWMQYSMTNLHLHTHLHVYSQLQRQHKATVITFVYSHLLNSGSIIKLFSPKSAGTHRLTSQKQLRRAAGSPIIIKIMIKKEIQMPQKEPTEDIILK